MRLQHSNMTLQFSEKKKWYDFADIDTDRIIGSIDLNIQLSLIDCRWFQLILMSRKIVD